MTNTPLIQQLAEQTSPAGNTLLSLFMEYATGRVIDQAIPFVSDGLLPAQRRQVLSMLDLGATSDKKHQKSSRIIANTAAEYHPRGNTYDVLVNQAQTWKVQVPIVDGEGNFGPIESGIAAAERYTEIRLSKFGEWALCHDIPSRRQKPGDKPHRITAQAPTYTDLFLEELYLPARTPVLLINGSTGIGVGLAQNWQPINARDVVRGVIEFVRTGAMDVNRLRLGYPAQPIISMTRQELTETLIKGRGSIKTRAKITQTPTALVITNITPGTITNSIGDAINEWLNDPNCPLRDYRNDSTPTECRLTCEIKRNTKLSHDEIEVMLVRKAGLTKSIPLQSIALNNRFPVDVGILDYMGLWVSERDRQVKQIALNKLEKITESMRRQEILLMLRRNLNETPNPTQSKPIAISLQAADTTEALLEEIHLIEDEIARSIKTEEMSIILDTNLRSLARLSEEQILKRYEALRAEHEHWVELAVNKEARDLYIIREQEELLQLFDQWNVPNYVCPTLDNVQVAEATTKTPTPNTVGLERQFEPTDEKDVLVHTNLGFVVRLRQGTVKSEGYSLSLLNGDTIREVFLPHHQKVLVLGGDGTTHMIQVRNLEYNKPTHLNTLIPQAAAQDAVVVCDTTNPTHLFIAYQSGETKNISLSEYTSLRATTKHPTRMTAAGLHSGAILLDVNGEVRRLNLQSAPAVSRSRVGRLSKMKLPSTKFTTLRKGVSVLFKENTLFRFELKK